MPESKPLPKCNTLQPYLIIKNCAAAIDFYKAAFRAAERMRMSRPDGRVAHAELQFGDTCVMMADEHPEIGALSPAHYGGSPVSLHFYDDDCDATFHRAIATGATQEQAPADQPYGERRAGIRDPFGYKWWIATPAKQK
ncbi:MAG: VOC family protein [Candidatus Acidiferrum sp.]